MTTPDWEALGRYVAGESPPEEERSVRRWLEEHPEDARLLAALESATTAAAGQRELDVEAAMASVKARARRGSAAALKRFAIIAAAAAVLFIAGRMAVTPPTDEAEIKSTSFATAVGERDSLPLGNGSRILLGPGTSIAVTREAGAATSVQLHGGQIFVSVKDGARNPVVVHAGAAVIRDIGTEFSVQYDSASLTRIVVQEGAVALTHRGDSLVLAAGDVGLVVPDSGLLAARGAARPEDLAWLGGRLVFRDASLHEIAADLRRWYGVELLVADSSLRTRHFTGSFSGEPATRVIEVIALALGASTERRGDTVLMRSGRVR